MMAGSASAVNKAILYSDPPTTKTHVAEIPVEQPGPGQVLVKILYSGVCHSDYAFCTNSWGHIPPTPKGQIGGHEGIGEVIAQGEGVTSPSIGAKVGIKYAAEACMNCTPCLLGGETSCTSIKISGYYTPGTFQQYCLTSAHYATPIPDGLDLAGAAPLMCAGVTVYTALKRAGVRSRDWVLVGGAGGGIGHLGIQYAKAMSARVLAVDSGAKEQFCREMGADEFLDFTKFKDDEELKAEVRSVSGGGVNIVLQCSSSNRAYAQSIGWLGFRGTLVTLGVPEGPPVPIDGATVAALVGDELRIIGVKTGNQQDAKECLEIAAKGLIKTKYELRPMDSLSQIFEDMEAGKINGRVVLDLR